MYLLRLICLFSVSFALVGSVSAEEGYPPCVENPNTNPEMIACMSQDYREYDKTLNKTYKQVTSMLSGNALTEFVIVQRAWIKFREKRCALESQESYPGTDAYLEGIGCDTKHTGDRTWELHHTIALIKKTLVEDESKRFLEVAGKAGFDKDKIRRKFYRLYSNEEEWITYVRLVCEYNQTYFKEDGSDCVFRLYFTRDD